MEWDTSKQIGKIVPIVEKTRVAYVSMENITHIVCSGYVSTVYLVNKSKHSSSRSLKSYEEEIGQAGFLRMNRQTLVNIRHATDAQCVKRMLYLGNTIIVVSKRKVSLLKRHNIPLTS